jgi:V-type H+-transporting ATPase subunit F
MKKQGSTTNQNALMGQAGQTPLQGTRSKKRLVGAAAAAEVPVGSLIAVIGDEDTVTGMLLAGVGNVDARRTANFLIVDSTTTPGQISETFLRFTKRSDVAIILINQYVASLIRTTVDEFCDQSKSPAILQIPSKEHPYDPDQDAIHRRTKLLLGIRD